MGEDEEDGLRDAGAGGPPSRAGSGRRVRVGETDLAILIAFCRSYIAGQRFPTPAPNNKILEELGKTGIYLDLDSLRTHLRNLYAKFGVEDGLTPSEKRVRLVALVYESGVIPGWGEEESVEPPPPASETPASSIEAQADSPADSTPPVPAPVVGRLPTLRRLKAVRDRPRAAAGVAAAVLLIGLSAIALVESRGGGGSHEPIVVPSDIKVIAPGSMSHAQGSVNYCVGADVVGSKDGKRFQHHEAVKDFNRLGPNLQAHLVELPADASGQYAQFRRRLRSCDVFYSDVTWTADFAHRGWLLDLTPYARPRLKSFLPAMQKAAIFDRKVWGVPKQADAGLLYYNTDTVKRPPTTWQDLYRQAAEGPGRRFRYQALDYEGLTVNFLELAYAAGAQDIVTGDRRANVDRGAEYEALQLMIHGIRTGAVPREVVDQIETDSTDAFGHARADLMRNWPYVYSVLKNRKEYPNVADHFSVAPLPTWEGQPPASVLGGHILVISSSSKNPGAALKLVDYLSSSPVIKRDATEFSLAPALRDLWHDPEVQRALPTFAYLKSAIDSARTRPITPDYPAVSHAISSNVNLALQHKLDPGTALATANDEIQQILDRAYGAAP
jgi:multiple sugar transport system substrate-binding protein